MNVEELKQQLAVLNEQLRDLREDISRNYLPRRVAARRWWVALSIIGVVLVMFLVGGYVTSRVTLAREHRIVAECFLLPGRLRPAKVAQCSRTFPGYGDLQRQSARNGKIFVDLQARVARLERQQKGR
jgi:hypothetical protein